MPHPAARAPRIGFALLLLPLLGSASPAPAPHVAVPGPQSSVPPRLADGRPEFVPALIPCVTGTCQAQMHVPAAPPQTRPLTPATPAPRTLARR